MPETAAQANQASAGIKFLFKCEIDADGDVAASSVDGRQS